MRNVRLREGYYQLGAYFASQFHRTDPDLVNYRIAIVRPGVYRWMIHRWWGDATDHYYVQTRLIRSGVGGGDWDDPVERSTSPRRSTDHEALISRPWGISASRDPESVLPGG